MFIYFTLVFYCLSLCSLSKLSFESILLLLFIACRALVTHIKTFNNCKKNIERTSDRLGSAWKRFGIGSGSVLDRVE